MILESIFLIPLISSIPHLCSYPFGIINGKFIGCEPVGRMLTVRATGEFLKMKEFLGIRLPEFLRNSRTMREKKLCLFLVDSGERIPQECEWVWICVEEFL